MPLNKEQEIAVKAKESKVLVLAPAASGKTTVLTERVKYLLEQGVPDKSIVAITFTNLAAYEMKKRLNILENTNIFIGTIHSYANRILLSHSIDTSDDIDRENFDNLLKKAQQVAAPHVKYLLVDEAQDLGDLEYNFLKSIHADNEYYVADDWQAIYAFKGSNVDIMFKWMRDPSFKVYKLSKNYRNGYKIIDFSLRLLNTVRRKSEKTVVPVNEYGGQIIECDYRKAIQHILDKRDFKDWFVLTRTNKEIEQVSGLLKELEIPFTTFKKSDLTLEEIENFLTQNVVKLLTIHTAKGLECENVIVIGTNMWNDNECRVAYVAASRAKTRLYWCPSSTPKTTYKPKNSKTRVPGNFQAMIDFSALSEAEEQEQEEEQNAYMSDEMHDSLSRPTDINEEVLGLMGFNTTRGRRALMNAIDDAVDPDFNGVF